jgi:hypothetical protein
MSLNVSNVIFTPNGFTYIATDEKSKSKRSGGGSIAIDSGVSDMWLASANKKDDSLDLVKIPDNELWSCARKSPKGRFLTWLVPKEAFKSGWQFASILEDEDELTPDKSKYLQKITKEHNLIKLHTRGVWVSRTFGRALIVKMPRRMSKKEETAAFYLRVTPVKDEEIYFDDDGEITHFHIGMKFGKAMKWITIEPKDTVMYINQLDPTGNNYDGISELESAYLPLNYVANIEESWANLMNKRGLGILDIEIEGADEDDLEAYKDKYGDPSQYAVIFHDQTWKVNSSAGISAQFNLENTVGVYTKEVSSSSGIGEARLNGVQQGMVTGSKTDGDNYMSIQRSCQVDYDDFLMSVYALIDESLRDSFKIEYNVDQKLDKAEDAQIFAMNISSVNQASEFLTYNEARKRLGLDAIEGGDVLLAEYLGNLGMTDPNDENADDPNSDDKNANKEEKKDEESEDLDENISRAELRAKKIDAAGSYLLQDKNMSYNEINRRLKEKFGSGLSYSDIKR